MAFEAERSVSLSKTRTADRASSIIGNADVSGEFLINDSKLEIIRQSIRVSPQVDADTVLSKMGFSTAKTRKNAFFGKNVLDVGGGFSGLAPLVSGY